MIQKKKIHQDPWNFRDFSLDFPRLQVLPSRDGGRQALLWCLAAGVPRDAQMTALCAPCEAAAGAAGSGWVRLGQVGS